MSIFVIHTADGIFERVHADTCCTEEGRLVIYLSGKPVAHYAGNKIIAVHREEMPALIHLQEAPPPPHPPFHAFSPDDGPSAA